MELLGGHYKGHVSTARVCPSRVDEPAPTARGGTRARARGGYAPPLVPDDGQAAAASATRASPPQNGPRQSQPRIAECNVCCNPCGVPCNLSR